MPGGKTELGLRRLVGQTKKKSQRYTRQRLEYEAAATRWEAETTVPRKEEGEKG